MSSLEEEAQQLEDSWQRSALRLAEIRRLQQIRDEENQRKETARQSIQTAQAAIPRLQQHISTLQATVDRHAATLQIERDAKARIRDEVVSENQPNGPRAANPRTPGEIDQEVRNREMLADNRINQSSNALETAKTNLGAGIREAAQLHHSIDVLLGIVSPKEPAVTAPAIPLQLPTVKPRNPPSNLPVFDPSSSKTSERDPRSFLAIYLTKARAAAATQEEFLCWFSSTLTPLVMRTYNAVPHNFTTIDDADKWLETCYNSSNEPR